MSSVERLNYLLNEVESLVSRNALTYKLFNNGLLIQITPDSSFGNISDISFRYKNPKNEEISKTFLFSNDLLNFQGDDLASKVLLYLEKLPASDVEVINKYYNDEDESPDQKSINFFTVGLASLATICQLILDEPGLFTPYSVGLPVSNFDTSLISQSLIDYIDGYLFNLSHAKGKVSTIATTLAKNAHTFNKYFRNLFVPGSVQYDITRSIQNSMSDFKNITYNADEIISNHLAVLEKTKNEFLEELKTDLQSYKLELRDAATINESLVDNNQNDNFESRAQDCLNDISNHTDREIEVIKKEGQIIIKFINEAKQTIEDQVEEAQNILDEVKTYNDSCNNSGGLTTADVEQVVKMQLSNFKVTTTPTDVAKWNELNDKLEAQISWSRNKINRIEKMLDKVLSLLNC